MRRVYGFRAVGAYGRYDYDGALFDGSNYVATTFDGQDSFAAALIGYQFRPGAVIVKLFGGIAVEDQHIVPHDPNNAVQGTEVGFRLLAETWYDIAPRWFLSADASYGTAFQEYWSLARVGFRVLPKLSLGLEGGALGNEEYDAGRGGASSASTSASSSSHCPAGSPATISKTIRAATWRSASIALSEGCRNGPTIAPFSRTRPSGAGRRGLRFCARNDAPYPTRPSAWSKVRTSLFRLGDAT